VEVAADPDDWEDVCSDGDDGGVVGEWGVLTMGGDGDNDGDGGTKGGSRDAANRAATAAGPAPKAAANLPDHQHEAATCSATSTTERDRGLVSNDDDDCHDDSAGDDDGGGGDATSEMISMEEYLERSRAAKSSRHSVAANFPEHGAGDGHGGGGGSCDVGGVGSYWALVPDGSASTCMREIARDVFIVCGECGARNSLESMLCVTCACDLGSPVHAPPRRGDKRAGAVLGDPSQWLPPELWIRILEPQSLATLHALANTCRSLRSFVTRGVMAPDAAVGIPDFASSLLFWCAQNGNNGGVSSRGSGRVPPDMVTLADPHAVLRYAGHHIHSSPNLLFLFLSPPSSFGCVQAANFCGLSRF
jgi:hypothetical protein